MTIETHTTTWKLLRKNMPPVLGMIVWTYLGSVNYGNSDYEAHTVSTPARPQQEGDDWLVRFLLSSPGRRVEPAEEQQPLVPLTRTNEELPRVEPAEERPLVPLTRSRSRSCSPDNKQQRRARKESTHTFFSKPNV